MDISNNKPLADIVNKHMKAEADRVKDMLDSIRAIHGENAYLAVDSAFGAYVQTNNALEMLLLTNAPPDETALTVVDSVQNAVGEKTRVLFHLAMGAPIGKCEGGVCNCDPRANELKKMYRAMMDAHQTHKVKAEKEVAEYLRAHD